MGKGMKAGKRKKPTTKRALTKQEFNKACNSYERNLKKTKAEITMDTSKLMSALCCYALNRRFGFGGKRLERLTNEINIICDEIRADSEHGWENVYNELAKHGMKVEGVTYDEHNKAIDW